MIVQWTYDFNVWNEFQKMHCSENDTRCLLGNIYLDKIFECQRQMAIGSEVGTMICDYVFRFSCTNDVNKVVLEFLFIFLIYELKKCLDDFLIFSSQVKSSPS